MSALVESPFFGITLTVIAYWLGIKAQKKTGLVICNNMIVSVAILIAVLTFAAAAWAVRLTCRLLEKRKGAAE